MIEVSEATVRAVLKSLGWAKPRQLRRLRGGVVNPAYCVNEEAIVRFNSRDLDQQKFLREKLCYERRPLLDLTPKVLHYFEAHPDFESEILVTEKLPGRRVSDDWPRMDRELKKALAREAAAALARMHETEFASFGAIENPLRQFGDWTRAVENELERIFKLSYANRIFSKDLEREVRLAFEKVAPHLAEVTSPRLVHGDFHFGNLLWSEGHLTAVIDFEWAAAGDPLMDFRNQKNLYDSAHGADELVAKEYMRLRALNIAGPRTTFYELLNKLELLSVSKRHWLGKVSWGAANHAQIEQGFARALAQLTS